MKKSYFLFLMIVVIGMCEKTFAQSRWIGIMPMEFNPSFAGNTGGHRIVALGGYEYSAGTSIGASTYRVFAKQNSPLGSVSYDNFIPKLASGIGFYVSSMKSSLRSKDNSDSILLVHEAIKAGINISPKISIRGKYTIAPSIGFNFKHYNYDYFPGIYKVYFDEKILKSNVFYLSTGLLFNTEKFYIGYAYYFAPINGKANIRSFYEDRYLNEKLHGYFQVGYNFRKNKDSKASYIVQTVFVTKAKTDWLNFINNLSFTFKYKRVLLGLSTNSWGMYNLNAGLGYQTGKLKIFYSQNLDYINYVYNGELSCRILIPNKKKTFYQF